MTPAERTRRLLALKGISLSDVARAAGLDRQAVWKIVKGETANPGLVTVEKIVEAAGSTMLEFYSLKELPMAEQLVQEVRRVLLAASEGKGTDPAYLTAFQILDRLPEALRDKLIQDRGGVGLGSGASFSPTRDIGIAVESLGKEVDKRSFDARGLSFKVGNQTVTAGYPLIAIYRIDPKQGDQNG